jgi:PAS domain S-box-containing protein
MKQRFSFQKEVSARTLIIALIFWTGIILASLYWNWHQVEKSTIDLASKEALSSFKKDITYRLWNSNHGGVYAPVTEQTPPNPFLSHMPERDIVTTSGTELTLINPAYMTRQVHELGKEQYGLSAHITSLKPIRPANAPDEWEITALEKFKSGTLEYISETTLDGQPYLRFMRPLITETSCLHCHASQGYREGDIRGGISVSIPLSHYRMAAATGQWPMLYGHLVIWVLGIAGIFFCNLFLRKNQVNRRLQFERIAGQISSNFMRLAPGNTEKGIEPALKTIGEFIASDRVYIFQFNEDKDCLEKSHEWCRDGIPPQIDTVKDISSEKKHDWIAVLKKFEIVTVPDFRHLPSEAIKKKKITGLNNALSFVAVPLILSSQFTGFLGADSPRKENAWMEEDIILLQLTAETIVHAFDRDRAEKALTRQTERLNRILHSTNVGTWEWNIQTGETVLNKRWAEISGYSLEEISPLNIKMWNQSYHPDDVKQSEDFLQECFRHENVYYNYEARVQHKNGDWVWIQDRGNVAVWTENGEPEWMYGIRTDISQRKKQERERQRIFEQLQQTQRLESMGVMAGGIAHDFNNILMIIMGNTELTLTELPVEAPERKNLLEVIKASENAAELCRQMLAYSGKGVIEKRNISLQHLVNETINMLKTSISKKSILNLNLKNNLPDIYADPTQLRQILMNLAINSSEAMEDKNGIITVSTGLAEELATASSQGYIVEAVTDGPHVYFEVSDNGEGFGPELVQRIFEPFFTTKFTGRGLGLSAVVGIVRNHKGALYVQSKPGKGTLFRIFFPAVTTPPDQLREVKTEDGVIPKGTVMLVDDEDAVRSVTAKILQKMGLNVISAIDGRQATEIFSEKQKEIAVVLLDLTMPQMNGEETLKELRKINPDIRVILASGYSKDIVSLRFSDQENVYCLQKPYTMAKLHSVLSKQMPDIKLNEEP